MELPQIIGTADIVGQAIEIRARFLMHVDAAIEAIQARSIKGIDFGAATDFVVLKARERVLAQLGVVRAERWLALEKPTATVALLAINLALAVATQYGDHIAELRQLGRVRAREALKVV